MNDSHGLIHEFSLHVRASRSVVGLAESTRLRLAQVPFGGLGSPNEGVLSAIVQDPLPAALCVEFGRVEQIWQIGL